MRISLRVYKNGDDTFLVWQTVEKIEGCRGFAVYRRLNGGKAVPLPSYAGFEDEQWKPGDQHPSTVWPVQKFMWSDYTVRGGDRVSYRVVPMIGPRKALKEDGTRASDWSVTVSLEPEVSPRVSCYFNRGIVATQWVQRMLGAKEGVRQRAKKLDKVVVDYANPRMRNLLAGELREGLLNLLAKARKEKLQIYAALFELADQELIEALASLKGRAYVVLADGAVKGGKGKKGKADDNDVPSNPGATKDENGQARIFLRKAGVAVHDRMTGGKFLAHNKILVVCDAKGSPRWTWTGSTNWTPSGLCTQANNGILIDDPKAAERFRQQIVKLATAGNASPAALAGANSKASAFQNPSFRVWFTRTLGQVDLADARRLISKARHAALFLMFQTGVKGSLLEAILKRRTEKSFYIHGVISSPPIEGGKKKGKAKGPKKKLTREEAIAKRVGLVHRGERVRYAPDLLLPFAIENKMGWFDEFVKKNGAHAIVHSKIVVLDPFGQNPVVITGSHNMGKTASEKNDENLVIFEGDKALAQAYAVNIMSIYDNYRWRFRVAQKSKWKGLWDNDRWQRNYAEGPGLAELNLWMGK